MDVHGCNECRHLIGRFHCGACGFNGGRSICANTPVGGTMIPEIHSYMHCKQCVMGHQTERLEAGLTATGIRVDCKKHGLVVHMTPDELRTQIARGPLCDCCPGGMHRS